MYDISTMVKAYWGVTFVPSPLFTRDKLKCGIDGESTIRHLDRDEVKFYIDNNRLNKWAPKNRVSGTSS